MAREQPLTSEEFVGRGVSTPSEPKVRRDLRTRGRNAANSLSCFPKSLTRREGRRKGGSEGREGSRAVPKRGRKRPRGARGARLPVRRRQCPATPRPRHSGARRPASGSLVPCANPSPGQPLPACGGSHRTFLGRQPRGVRPPGACDSGAGTALQRPSPGSPLLLASLPPLFLLST